MGGYGGFWRRRMRVGEGAEGSGKGGVGRRVQDIAMESLSRSLVSSNPSYKGFE